MKKKDFLYLTNYFSKKIFKLGKLFINMGRIREHVYCHSSGGGIYGLGFIGAAIYYVSNATTFWMGVLGILKALVWPAFLVYELFKYLAA